MMSLDPASLLSSPILLSLLSLAFCLHSLVGWLCALLLPLSVSASYLHTHEAYPSSHSSLHLWHCHSPLADSPPLLAELLHSIMSHARTAAAAAAAAVSDHTNTSNHQSKRISAMQAQGLNMPSSDQCGKHLTGQKAPSRIYGAAKVRRFRQIWMDGGGGNWWQFRCECAYSARFLCRRGPLCLFSLSLSLHSDSFRTSSQYAHFALGIFCFYLIIGAQGGRGLRLF